MKKLLPLRLALRELAGNRLFAISFILNMSLGLVGFLTLDAFKASIANHLSGRSQAILAADLVVSGRRLLTPEEESIITEVLPPGTVSRREISTMTMAAYQGESRLVEVRAVDEKFPFYGTLELESGKIDPGDPVQVATEKIAWLYPELLVQLGVSKNEQISVGGSTFTVADVVTRDPAMSSSTFMIAPRIFIGAKFIEDTGLVQKGSRIFHSYLYKLPAGVELAPLAETLQKRLVASDIRVRTHMSSSERLERAIMHLNDYLGLVALVALFLAAVGAAYLFRSYLGRRTQDIAVLRSLGLTRGGITLCFVLQLVMLGTAAAMLSGLFTTFALPLLRGALGGLVSDELAITLGPQSVAITISLGSFGAVLFCLPMLVRLQDLNPIELFRENAHPQIAWRPRYALLWLPALTCYWALAVWQAKSWITGSLFVAIFLGAGAILVVVGLFFLNVVGKHMDGKPLAIRLAGLALARHKAASLSCFAAIGLGSLLVNIIPQLRAVIDSELEQPEETLPSLFMFDIQDEQVSPLQELLAAENAPVSYISPMIRARYTALNGEPVSDDGEDVDGEGTRDEEQRSRMRNRSFNLSYRASLASSESMAQGVPFSGKPWNPDEPAELSLESRFAARIGVSLGDIMEFDVQGVRVSGKVVNFRDVRWTSFQPNFFVQFQPGVLEDAPKTFIASLPPLSFDEKIALQKKIVASFPNVSIVDVEQTVSRILSVVTQMSSAVRFMAIMTLIAGLAVLFSIARHQAITRLKDVHLLKILGTSHGSILSSATLEFLSLGLVAASFGAVLSLLAGGIVAEVVFQSRPNPEILTPLVSVAAVTLTSTFLGLLATLGSLGTPSGLAVKQPA